MRVNNLEELRNTPTADLYICMNGVTGASMATHQIADVEHFLRHCGEGYVETFVRQRQDTTGIRDPHLDPLCEFKDVEFLKRYADAIVTGLTRRRAIVPLTLAQEAELKVSQVALKALLREQSTPVKIVVNPLFVVELDNAKRRDCSLCGAEGVATLHDPDGVVRCEHCFDDIVADHKFTCPRCKKTLTTPRASGSHYCHVEDQKDE